MDSAKHRHKTEHLRSDCHLVLIMYIGEDSGKYQLRGLPIEVSIWQKAPSRASQRFPLRLKSISRRLPKSTKASVPPPVFAPANPSPDPPQTRIVFSSSFGLLSAWTFQPSSLTLGSSLSSCVSSCISRWFFSVLLSCISICLSILSSSSLLFPFSVLSILPFPFLPSSQLASRYHFLFRWFSELLSWSSPLRSQPGHTVRLVPLLLLLRTIFFSFASHSFFFPPSRFAFWKVFAQSGFAQHGNTLRPISGL